MNRLAHWMLGLYPSRWRKRYGDELDALLTETGADTRIVADLAGGGIRMQFSTWSFPKLAIVLGSLGVVLGLLGSFLAAPVYISESRLRIDPATEHRLEPLVTSRTSLARIINYPELLLYKDEQKVRPLEDVIETMRRDIAITQVSPDGDFAISFRYRDPEKTQGVVEALASKFRSLASSTQAPSDTPGATYVEMIDLPSLPIRPTFPIQTLAPWLSAALVVGGLVAWRRSRRRNILTWRFGLATAASALIALVAGSLLVYLAIHRQGGSSLPGVRFRSTALIRLNGTPEQNQSLLQDAVRRTSSGRSQHLSIQPAAADPHYFRIVNESHERFESQRAVRAAALRLFEAAPHSADASATSPIRLQPAVLRLPSLPVDPIKPNRATAAALGGLAGLFAAAIIAIVRNRWKPEPGFPLDAIDG